MNQRILELTIDLEKTRAASQDALTQLESELGLRLPDDYKEFMRLTNGAEGRVSKRSYVIIWPVEEIVRYNKGYAVEEFAPGLLLFASTGGGMAYAFDTRDPRLPVVEVPFIGMSLNSAKQCGASFTEFLENLGRK